MRAKRLDLDKDSRLYYDGETIKGTLIRINYKRYRVTGPYARHMAEMFLLLTNWKSNRGYPVVDFKTFTGTDKLEIVMDCNETEARNLISHFNYFDYENLYSSKENGKFLLLEILDCREIEIFKLYKDHEDFEEIYIQMEE